MRVLRPSVRRCRGSATLTLLIAALVAGCSAGKSTVSPAGPGPSVGQNVSPESKALFDAERSVVQHRPEEAISTLDPVIRSFEATHGKSETQVYCSRSMPETLAYMRKAQGEGRNAVALDVIWADAYYLKGYALIELDRLSDARIALEKALALSPLNSRYLSEIGHTWQSERNWNKALETFTRAEEVTKYSPDGDRIMEQTRALRGQGFSLTELGRLDEAASKYRASLALDRGDVKSKHELEYIEQVRKRE